MLFLHSLLPDRGGDDVCQALDRWDYLDWASCGVELLFLLDLLSFDLRQSVLGNGRYSPAKQYLLQTGIQATIGPSVDAVLLHCHHCLQGSVDAFSEVGLWMVGGCELLDNSPLLAHLAK